MPITWETMVPGRTDVSSIERRQPLRSSLELNLPIGKGGLVPRGKRRMRRVFSLERTVQPARQASARDRDGPLAIEVLFLVPQRH